MTDWLIDIIPQACPPDVMDAPEAYRAALGTIRRRGRAGRR